MSDLQKNQNIPSTHRRVKKSASPPIPPPESGCHFYIPKKNRYCKMAPGKNQRYCGEHIMSESGQEVPSAKIRVPCPIDPTHTCFQNQLQKHLKICNARLEDQPPGLLICEDFKIIGSLSWVICGKLAFFPLNRASRCMILEEMFHAYQ